MQQDLNINHSISRIPACNLHRNLMRQVSPIQPSQASSTQILSNIVFYEAIGLWGICNLSQENLGWV